MIGAFSRRNGCCLRSIHRNCCGDPYHLKGLNYLQTLWLTQTQVTDAGLEHLKGLTSLQGLNLMGTQVTDAGLVHLQGLTSVERLYLSDTQVTDPGVNELKKAFPNCQISH